MFFSTLALFFSTSTLSRSLISIDTLLKRLLCLLYHIYIIHWWIHGWNVVKLTGAIQPATWYQSVRRWTHWYHSLVPLKFAASESKFQLQILPQRQGFLTKLATLTLNKIPLRKHWAGDMNHRPVVDGTLIEHHGFKVHIVCHPVCKLLDVNILWHETRGLRHTVNILCTDRQWIL